MKADAGSPSISSIRGWATRVRHNAPTWWSAATACIRSSASSLHPHEGEPRYSGVNMWRGVTPWEPFLSGASMVRAGWLTHGKMVIYPIRNSIDTAGGSSSTGSPKSRRRGIVTSAIGTGRATLETSSTPIADWHFDWLDVPGDDSCDRPILEFPMIDQDPLPWWTQGRVTLLGDAAHPMLPRGSNGAGQPPRCESARGRAGAAPRRSRGRIRKSYEQSGCPATDQRRADEPREPAGCDHPRSVFAHGRPAVCAHRRRHQRRRVARDLGPLQARRAIRSCLVASLMRELTRDLMRDRHEQALHWQSRVASRVALRTSTGLRRRRNRLSGQAGQDRRAVHAGHRHRHSRAHARPENGRRLEGRRSWSRTGPGRAATSAPKRSRSRLPTAIRCS